MSVKLNILRKLVRELIKREIEEATMTGNIDGGAGPPKTPLAFKKKKKGQDESGLQDGHVDPTVATDYEKVKESVNEAGGVVTARIQQKPKGYWAVFNKKGQSQFEGNKKFMINIFKKASTLSPNAIGSILDRARPGAKHLEFKAQFSRYYFNESIKESGMGILDKDQTDVLHAIVMRNKNKNSNSILKIALKDRMFKGIDKRELLGYIEGTKQFVRYMGRTGNESVNEQKKRDANNLNMEFEKSYQRFTVAVNGLVKSMDNISGEKTDGKIIVKAFKKYLVPFHRLVNSWNKGYQKNPHINETQKRDYKAEYKKFQSSTKAKKYRAELNQYNRKKGTYGNNDGKDASHKGGKIVGFEKESTNRGRREKSRLKKEDIREDIGLDVYLGGIIKAMRKSRLKPKTAKVMKHGFSKSKDKIGFFIDVEQRGFDKKETFTLQFEVDRDGYLWYLSAPKDIKIGKWADTSQLVRGFKKLDRLPGFGQDAIFKRRR